MFLEEQRFFTTHPLLKSKIKVTSPNLVFVTNQKRTKYTHVDAKWDNSTSPNRTLVHEASDTVPAGTMAKGGMNVLGLVVFSIVFGAVLSRLGNKGLPLKAFFEALNDVIMKMVTLVMWYVILYYKVPGACMSALFSRPNPERLTLDSIKVAWEVHKGWPVSG